LSAGNLCAAARTPELINPHIGDLFFTKSDVASFRWSQAFTDCGRILLSFDA